MQEQGKLLILAPDDTAGVDTTKRTKEGLLRLYTKGCMAGAAVRDFLFEA